jgi:hypothetical protein
MMLVSFEILTCGCSLKEEIRILGKIHNCGDENRPSLLYSCPHKVCKGISLILCGRRENNYCRCFVKIELYPFLPANHEKKQEVGLGSMSAITAHGIILIQTLGRKVKN